MKKIFVEENGVFQFDCTKAKWATDQLHHEYHNSGVHLSDVDFLIEDEAALFMVEYKNADIPNAANPSAFNPEECKRFTGLVHKFYDSLHYLHLLGKTVPVKYICVLEYPNGDQVTRKRLRDRLHKELPFSLQENMATGRKLIEAVDVVSIEEWNENEIYGKYPISLVEAEGES